jgi:uncharacterized protein
VLERLLEWMARNRTVTLAVAFALFAAAALSLPRLQLNDAPERWMPAGSVEAWRKFDRHFARGDNVGIAIHFHRPVRDDDADYLAGIRRRLLAVPGIVSVIDMSVAAREIERVPLTQILKEPADRDDDPYAMYRGVLFDDPKQWNPDVAEAASFGSTSTGSEAGSFRHAEPPRERTLIAYVELDTGVKSGESRSDDDEQERRRHAVAELNRIVDAAARDDVTFHVIGAIVIQHELERMARTIAMVFIPLSVVLTFVALGVSFRSLSAVSLAVVAAVWSVTVLMGGVVWAGWSLNVVTVGGPTLMFVIVVATAIHFAHYEADRPQDHRPVALLDKRRENGSNNPSASRRSSSSGTAGENGVHQLVRWVAIPCLGAAVTTGFGFLMLAFNELAPTRELGIELGIGAVLAFFGVFVVRLVIPVRKRPDSGHWLTPDRLRRFYRATTARPRAVIVAMCAMMAVFAVAASRLEIDADPFSFFRPQSKMARAFRHIGERQFGMYLLDVVLVPKHRPVDPREREIAAVEDRRVAAKFQREIGRRPEVRNLVSTMEFERQQDRLEIAKRVDPKSKEVRRLAKSVETFRDIFRRWMVDEAGEGALRISFKVDDLGNGFQDLVDDARAKAPTDRFDVIISGTAADTGALAEGLLGGMLRGLATAFALMAVVCLFWFRSVRLTAIAFLPNLFPVLFVLGVMGLFGVPLNSGTVMVTTIALGVALTDTVHVVIHYRERRLEGEATEIALTDTFAEIGRPIVMTSVVNCLGFSIFLFSEFRPMADFGLLTGLAMLAALAGDLFLLPCLLKVFDRTQPAAAD